MRHGLIELILVASTWVLSTGFHQMACFPRSHILASRSRQRPTPGSCQCFRPALPPTAMMTEGEGGGESTIKVTSGGDSSIKVTYPTPNEGAKMGIREWPGYLKKTGTPSHTGPRHTHKSTPCTRLILGTWLLKLSFSENSVCKGFSLDLPASSHTHTHKHNHMHITADFEEQVDVGTTRYIIEGQGSC